jgi:hypothetical protein
MIEKEYKGITYSYSEELQFDLKNLYDIDVDKEIQRGIQLSLQSIDVGVNINNNNATLTVTAK